MPCPDYVEIVPQDVPGLMYCAYVILGELSTYVLKMCYDYLGKCL